MKVRANGKILLTGEYGVLDGALALALPTKLGQLFEIKTGRGSEIKWSSLDDSGEEWFSCVLSLYDFSSIKTTDIVMAERLGNLLEGACRLNSDFLSTWKGISINSKLEFNHTWGLGSSSTLIYFISQWAEVDPYELMAKTFGGSGYDIACCDRNNPILYQKLNGLPEIKYAEFNPGFKDNLYFVHLNNSVNSAEAIENYGHINGSSNGIVDELSDLTKKINKVKRFTHFEKLVDRHENILSEYLDAPTVQKTHFNGYWGKVKSLGAWGGDMVLVTSDRSEEDTQRYFNDRGYETFFKYNDLILGQN